MKKIIFWCLVLLIGLFFVACAPIPWFSQQQSDQYPQYYQYQQQYSQYQYPQYQSDFVLYDIQRSISELQVAVRDLQNQINQLKQQRFYQPSYQCPYPYQYQHPRNPYDRWR